VKSVVTRASRVSTAAIEARLGSELGRLINVSATGALVRTSGAVTTGRQCPMFLNLPDVTATLLVRVVRSEGVPVEVPGAMLRLRQYEVGVEFTQLSGPAQDAVASLCGPKLTERE